MGIGTAAQVALFMTLALSPFLLLLLLLIGYLHILELDQTLNNLREALPEPAYDLVSGTIYSVLSQHEGSILDTVYLNNWNNEMPHTWRQVGIRMRYYNKEWPHSFFEDDKTPVETFSQGMAA